MTARIASAPRGAHELRPDGELLAAFRDTRDAEAFGILVRRHAPRVLGVCRRITGHDHDADDAAQAVFMVLARRAADIRPPEGVGAWLYGVACRTAREARSLAARRASRVAPVARVPESWFEDVPPDPELAAELDREIGRLPDAQRAAVVMCELDGVSRRDAAHRLGIAEGTLSSRLADARRRLADRLKRRGFVLPAVLAVVLPSAVVASDFPIPPVAPPIPGRAAGVASAGAVALAEGVLRAMLLKRIAASLLVVCCALALLTGGWLGLRQALAADPKETKLVEVKPATREGRLVFWAQDGIRLIDPDGKNDTRVLDRMGKNPDGAVLSPDGISLAWLDAVVPPPDQERPARPVKKLYLRKLSEAKVREFAIDGQMLSWSPDGRELMVTCFHDSNEGPLDLNCVILEAATGKQTAMVPPKDHIPTDIAPDGKSIVASTLEGAVVQLSRDGKVEKTLSDAKYGAHMGRVSSDGKTLLFLGMKAAAKKADGPREGEARLYVQPVGGQAVELKDVPIGAGLSGFCWSPDGKRIAYTWRVIHAEKAPEGQVDERETESHLCVCDADGGNHRTLVSEKGRGQYLITIGSVDWR